MSKRVEDRLEKIYTKSTMVAQDQLVNVNVRFAVVGNGRNAMLWNFLGLLGAVVLKPRFLVVTDQEVGLFKAKSIRATAIGDEITSVPLTTTLDRFKPLSGKLTFPDGQRIYISKPAYQRIQNAMVGQ